VVPPGAEGWIGGEGKSFSTRPEYGNMPEVSWSNPDSLQP
jgi:hypothetical protein